MTELELLAPARNADIGIAAINCGADAVYIAGPLFGARQAAGNSVDDIARLCSYAHGFGARVFVTVNTIIYEDELPAAEKLLREIILAGADAVIAQDLAVIDIVRRLEKEGLPRIDLHASTQCSCRTADDAELLESLGFSRIILERELSLEQVGEIRDAVDAELEFFVHGALCVCYSGQCYLSEYLAGRSANRGACAQACRSRYDLVDGNGECLVRNKALLSLKDYNLKDRIRELAEAGICSFKIEGRLKNESYVKNVVREYSLALDALVKEAPADFRRASYGSVHGGFNPNPDKTFNRGYTELFIDGKRGQWAAMDAAKGMGEYVGRVISANPSGTRIEVRAEKELHNGDGLSFITKNGDVNGFRCDTADGGRLGCQGVTGLYPGASLYRNIDVAFEKELAANACRRLLDVKLDVRVEPSSIKVKAVSEDGRTLEREFQVNAQQAQDIARMEAVIASQLSKSAGIFSFRTNDVSHGPQMPLLPASLLNGIRREIAAVLEKALCRTSPTTGGRNEAGHRVNRSGAVSYKSNVANSIAERIYRSLGAAEVESAYELTHRPGVELMRTRYCIRHELGMCPRQGKGKVPERLFLVNNGRRLALEFDCRACEMVVRDCQ